jgi:hypothetical protein
MTKQRPLRSLLRAAVLAAAMCGPAAAQDGDRPPQSNTPGQCINAGQTYGNGEFACIAACHGRRRLARCDAPAAQASNWTYVAESCPTAMNNPPWPDTWSEIPAVAAMSPIPLVVDRSAPAPEMRLRFATFSKKQSAAAGG